MYVIVSGSPIIRSEIISSNITHVPLVENATDIISAEINNLVENVTSDFRHNFNEPSSTKTPIQKLANTILWKDNFVYTTTISTLNQTMPSSTSQMHSSSSSKLIILIYIFFTSTSVYILFKTFKIIEN